MLEVKIRNIQQDAIETRYDLVFYMISKNPDTVRDGFISQSYTRVFLKRVSMVTEKEISFQSLRSLSRINLISENNKRDKLPLKDLIS